MKKIAIYALSAVAAFGIFGASLASAQTSCDQDRQGQDRNYDRGDDSRGDHRYDRRDNDRRDNGRRDWRNDHRNNDRRDSRGNLFLLNRLMNRCSENQNCDNCSECDGCDNGCSECGNCDNDCNQSSNCTSGNCR